ncbi:MAG: class I SAM-dependent methyltransferase [Lachnospiraceae bacterium]|nr:class I SAM-dependent methyltransferase [Lachnospiraceae bacterium]
MEQNAYWNSVSETKQFTTPFQADVFARHVAGDQAILDVGCGYGRTLQELWELGYQNLTGIDFSQGMIDRGHRMFPHLDLRLKETALRLSDSTEYALQKPAGLYA